MSLTVGGFLIGVVAGFLALGIAALFLAYTIAPATPSREE